MDIEELSKKIDKYHEEDKNEAKKDRRENLGWIGWGFALAIFSNYFATKDLINVWFAIFFFIIGFILLNSFSNKKRRK